MKGQSAGPVLQVSDLGRSLKYYTEVLGFVEDFRFGEYAGVRNGDALLHLCAHTIHRRPIGGGAAFVFCDEVDDYHKEIEPKGAIVKVKPEDRPYGMKDFTLLAAGLSFMTRARTAGVDGAPRPVAETACGSRRSTSASVGAAEGRGTISSRLLK